MREMKNSGVEWIGEIPVDWDTIKIKQLPDRSIENSFVDGDWIESPDISDEGIRYLTTGNIGDGKYKKQGNGFVTLEVFQNLNCKYAYPGDLVISRLNAPYGRSCILPDDYSEYVLAVDNVILRTNNDKKYICYITQCDGYQKSVEDNAKGTTMKRISRTNLGNVLLPFPPLSEQHRIADFLDEKCAKIDAVIEKQKQVIEKLKEYKLSVITEAVTKGLDPTVPMKDSGVEWIGEIPEGWHIGKLRFFSEKIGDGLHGTPNFGSGDCFFVNGNNLGKRKIQIKQDTKTVDDIEYFKYRINLNTNTLLISLNGTIGNISEYHNEKLILGKSAGYIIVSDNYSKDYLRYYLQGVHAKTIYELSFAGTTINNLSLETLRNLPVCVFDINKQREIAKFLDKKSVEIDSAIDKKQAIIYKLTEYKKSLIYEVVTGKKEV